MHHDPYPVTFSVEYPDRKLNRLSTAFRLFAAIPIMVVAALLQSQELIPQPNQAGTLLFIGTVTGSGIIVFPLVLMILSRRKYPHWWYAWNLELLRFTSRITVYLALMDDRYPSTDQQQAVRLDFPHPDADKLNRGLPLIKWLLAFPHYVLLAILSLAVVFAVVGAWFAILLTGRYPRGIFNFVEGVLRWGHRVTGYGYTLVTDRYPPFRLSP